MDFRLQAPLSMEFSRQEYWSGLPFPAPGDLPDPGIELTSALAGRFFTTEPPGSPGPVLGSHYFVSLYICLKAYPGDSVDKRIHLWCRRSNSSGRSRRSPGEAHGNSNQYSCLKNSMHTRAWWATVHRVTKSQTRLKQLNTHAK